MKRGEYERKLAEGARLRQEARDGTPAQREVIGGVVVEWSVNSRAAEGDKPYMCGATFESSHWGAVTIQLAGLARVSELNQQLEAWARDEGDWPLSKNPPAEQP